MVTRQREAGTAAPAEDPATGRPPEIQAVRIHGAQPPSAESVAALGAVCDRAEESGARSVAVLYLTGAPGPRWADDLTVAMVSKWERVLRRFERLPAATIAVAGGDCGGTALEALLTTDYRIATRDVRLVVPVQSGATWPGMALYRLAQQAGTAPIRRAALFGVPLAADDALALRLIDELTVAPASAVAAATALAGAVSGAELAIRRQLVLEAPAAAFEDALGVHLAACDRTLRRASAGAP